MTSNQHCIYLNYIRIHYHYKKAMNESISYFDKIVEAKNKAIFVCQYLTKIIQIDNNITKTTWKELSNVIVSLPDLAVTIPDEDLKPTRYYSIVISCIFKVVSENFEFIDDGSSLLFCDILGRLSLIGYSKIVWKEYTLKAIHYGETKTKKCLLNILSLPTFTKNNLSTSILKSYIEKLYMPLFFYLDLDKNNGETIKQVLSYEHAFVNETLRYDIFKSLLKSYTCSKSQQLQQLVNYFLYLSSIKSDFYKEKTNSISRQQKSAHATSQDSKENENKTDKESINSSTNYHQNDCKQTTSPEEQQKIVSPLLCILDDLVVEWSTKVKVLLRPKEQNTYISKALILAFKFGFMFEITEMKEKSIALQLQLVSGVPLYLERASVDQRNLAVCVGECVFPKLQQLVSSKDIEDKLVKVKAAAAIATPTISTITSGATATATKSKQLQDQVDEQKQQQVVSSKISFGIDLDDESAELKDMFNCSLDDLFNSDFSSSTDKLSTIAFAESTINKRHKSRDNIALDSDDDENDGDDEDDNDDGVKRNENDYDCTKDSNSIASDIDFDKGILPVYIGDCITKLADNDKPELVEASLKRVTLLIKKLSNINKPTSTFTTKVSSPSSSKGKTNTITNISSSKANKSIRDIAVELARVLLHLDNQFNIKQFSAYRLQALCCLCYEAPDLVATYLLDEFNKENKSVRHQLDIMQVLVATATKISSDFGACHFVKYAPLFFYGIAHQFQTPFITTSIEGGLESLTLNIDKLRQQPKVTKLSSLSIDKLLLQVSSQASDDLQHNRINSRISEPNSRQTILSSSSTGIDDSYLLTRILYSLSLILKSCYQQPITRRLSTDLANIVNLFAASADSGVRQAIKVCIDTIENCTPKGYLS